MMEEDKREDRERRRREKGERKQRSREEKARLKEERKEARERRKREKLQALEELQELPEVAEGEGEALACLSPEAGGTPPGGPETGAEAGAGRAGAETEEGLAEEGADAPGFEGGKAAGVELEPALAPEDGRLAAPPKTASGTGVGTPSPAGTEPVVPAGEKGEEERAGEEVSPEEEKRRWLARLRDGLFKSRVNLVAPLSRALATRRFDDAFWEEVEDILVGADVGMEMTVTLVGRAKERMAREKVKDPEAFLELFREELAESLEVGDGDLCLAESGPSVIMVVGVNGTGKTTTIAKLAHLLRRQGKRVVLAAGDTFRAAGIEQLETWGERVGVHTVKHRQGADAAAVVHDAVEAARAREVDVVIADTAGRLHTKVNLMEELRKIKRVAERNAAVTETLLVIDATTGQNGLIQARRFREAVDVTGVVLTKLDGTAKGGIVVAIVHELGIPIKFIGVGEALDDLHPFDPREFAQALISPMP